jgi:hypothetical protein
MTQPGPLEYFDGQWHRPYSFPYSSSFNRALAVIQPGEAIAVDIEGSSVVRIKDGVAHEEKVPEGSGGPEAAANVPGVGQVVGTTEGAVLLYDPMLGWQPIAPPPFRGLFAYVLTPYNGGFLLGAVFGDLAQYLPGHGFCSMYSAETAFDIYFIVPLGDDLVLAGTNPASPTTPIAVLRPN